MLLKKRCPYSRTPVGVNHDALHHGQVVVSQVRSRVAYPIVVATIHDCFFVLVIRVPFSLGSGGMHFAEVGQVQSIRCIEKLLP